MKKKLFLAFLCTVLISAAVLCDAQNNIRSVPAAPAYNNKVESTIPKVTTPSAKTFIKNDVKLKQGETKFLELTEKEESILTGFASSDTDIAEIDSGGRVDAISTGTAKITANFSDKSKAEYKIIVTEADKKDIDRFSTCITANDDILYKNKKSGSNKLYEIKVNRRQNCVTVYTYDKNGKYTVPVRAMVCSTGANNSTITGTYGIYFKNEWHALYQGVYGHYVSGISGDYLFHSVPYYTANSDDIEIEEFNKLGRQASLGCVRLAASDTKWIYDNCPNNTQVTIYDDDDPGPLGKPETIKISDKNCGWDPTDNSSDNPYYSKTPVISGANDCIIKKGDQFYPLGGVSAVDTCSNDITNRITVTGNVVPSRTGRYKVTYSVTDVLNRTDSVDITVTVQ